MVCDVGIGYASLWVVLDTVRRLRNKIGVGVEVGFGIGVEVGVGEFELEPVVKRLRRKNRRKSRLWKSSVQPWNCMRAQSCWRS